MGTGCSSDRTTAQDGQSLKAKTVPAMKVVIVGDPSVGKTNIFLRYMRNQFSPLYIPTQRAVIENHVMKVNLPSHAVVSLSLWDIPGREDIDLYKSYFRNLDAAIVVVDVSDPESIMMANVWKQTVVTNIEKTRPLGDGDETQEETGTLAVDPVKFPVLLLGTKCDIVEQRMKTEGQSLYPQGKRLKDTDFSKLSSDDVEMPDKGTEKPACVVELEKMAEDHNFVGSVMVSAREGDGSVHTAIQSFIRHILEDQFIERRWKPRTQTDEVAVKDEKKITGRLKTIGIEQVDKAFGEKELVKIFDRIDTLKNLNHKSFKKFVSLCEDIEVIGQGEGSIENCIVGLRKYLGETDFKLQLVEKEGVSQLRVKRLSEDTHMSKALKNILTTFNKEYAASGAAILKEFPPLAERLERVDQKVAVIVASYEEPVEPGAPTSGIREELKSRSAKVEENRAVLQHYQCLASQCCQNVNNVFSRAKTAFIW
ncbi:uncharacterized protein [Haliotis cracherodii]|uniref:uncharacterized protein n=1 Tax=Haliotis cracherodii TaxID=6455 RepID=UPI0039ED93B9